jgi:hypothetical protein
LAKPVMAAFADAVISFDASRVDRNKIYGARKRAAFDGADRPCTRASLSLDGALLFTSGMLGQAYFTREGRVVARSEMVGLDAEGNPVATTPSTLGVAQALEGPVDPAELLDVDFDAVYLLLPEDAQSALVGRLTAGEIFRLPFNYAASLQAGTAYVLSNDQGIFALVGRPATVNWVEEESVFVADTSEEDVDDLDFDNM